MNRECKILILVMPIYGHLNPMASFVNELAKVPNFKIIFPGNQRDRNLIEATNAEFRHMEVQVFDPKLNMNLLHKNPPFDKLKARSMLLADTYVPRLVRLVEEENIDLIIYDYVTIYAKCLRGYLHKEHSQGFIKSRKPPPNFIMFCPSFMCAKDIYPNKAEPPHFNPKLSFMVKLKMLLLSNRFRKFEETYGFKIQDQSNFLHHREEFNLCCVVPELQPRSHLFEKSDVFVGSCVSEELRGSKALEEPLKSFLAPFEPSNPVPLRDLKVDEDFLAKRNKVQLVYASFGTVFNENIKHCFQREYYVIQAFKSIDQQGSNKLRLLISTGEKTYAKFQEMTRNGAYEPQDDILLMDLVPQLDVLKRASVFITHSGQGSTSESIHYGVPMICVPVYGDQPSVAYRCADELGLGIRLNYEELSSVIIRNAISKILTDKNYLERVTLFSQISRKYDGPKNAAKQVLEYLKKTPRSLEKADVAPTNDM